MPVNVLEHVSQEKWWSARENAPAKNWQAGR